jgi:hypothetical protein
MLRKRFSLIILLLSIPIVGQRNYIEEYKTINVEDVFNQSSSSINSFAKYNADLYLQGTFNIYYFSLLEEKHRIYEAGELYSQLKTNDNGILLAGDLSTIGQNQVKSCITKIIPDKKSIIGDEYFLYDIKDELIYVFFVNNNELILFNIRNERVINRKSFKKIIGAYEFIDISIGYNNNIYMLVFNKSEFNWGVLSLNIDQLDESKYFTLSSAMHRIIGIDIYENIFLQDQYGDLEIINIKFDIEKKINFCKDDNNNILNCFEIDVGEKGYYTYYSYDIYAEIIFFMTRFDNETLKFYKLKMEKLFHKLFKNIDKSKLRIIRNTVFAKYGKIFKSYDLQQYFNKEKWYKKNPKYNDKMLTDNDRKIINSLLKLENYIEQ